MENNLAVNRRLKNGTLPFQHPPETLVVNQIAIVSNGNGAALGGDQKRLAVYQLAAPGGGIAIVPNGHMSFKLIQAPDVGEHIGYQSHIHVAIEVPPIRGNDSRTFLSPVLEGIETQIG